MKNFKDIFRLLMLIALFSCWGSFTVKAEDGSGYSYVQSNKIGEQDTKDRAARAAANERLQKQQYMDSQTAGLSAGWSVTGNVGGYTHGSVEELLAITSEQKQQLANHQESLSNCQKECASKKGYNCQVLAPDNQYHCVPVPVVGTAGDTKGEGVITGCTKNSGLFSGLINTGKKIFEGLRDLIYVVAGFGIIGVAVGGFFGNLNWKWLGAIVIALVVIASTGELIVAITGCQEFTQNLITDTLK